MTPDLEPCVWCNYPTRGRNIDGEAVCGDYECQRDDHLNRLRRQENQP